MVINYGQQESELNVQVAGGDGQLIGIDLMKSLEIHTKAGYDSFDQSLLYDKPKKYSVVFTDELGCLR